MPKINLFSIKWKFAFLISTSLILLLGYLTYFSYFDTTKAFLQQGKKAQNRYSHIAEAIIRNSSKGLELFAESIFLAKHSDDTKKLPQDQTISLLDKNLPNGQLVWGLEAAVLTDDKGKRIKEWGSVLKNLNGQVQRVLKMEKPVHTILCEETQPI